MNRARFLEEAETEFLKEVQYCAEVQAQGAQRFRMAVEQAAARALAFPMAGVVILAVVHEARRPGYWRSRT